MFSSGIKNLDADSIGNFQQTSSLAVQSRGVRTDQGGQARSPAGSYPGRAEALAG